MDSCPAPSTHTWSVDCWLQRGKFSTPLTIAAYQAIWRPTKLFWYWTTGLQRSAPTGFLVVISRRCTTSFSSLHGIDLRCLGLRMCIRDTGRNGDDVVLGRFYHRYCYWPCGATIRRGRGAISPVVVVPSRPCCFCLDWNRVPCGPDHSYGRRPFPMISLGFYICFWHPKDITRFAETIRRRVSPVAPTVATPSQ